MLGDGEVLDIGCRVGKEPCDRSAIKSIGQIETTQRTERRVEINQFGQVRSLLPRRARNRAGR